MVMIKFLAKIFIKADPADKVSLRRQYGMLCSVAGICLNALLFLGKFLAGLFTASVSVMADAFNNLSDAASSVITLTGFRLSGQKPDVDHPFGHGRIEYVSGLLVSLAIMLMGFELLKTSVGKIFSPEELVFSPVSLVILVAAVGVKFYMGVYNRSYGKKFDSSSMKATAADCFSDVCATTAVLISYIVYMIFDINIDAYCGAAVSLFILFSGFRAAKETIDPLLGMATDSEVVKEIERIVMSYDGIIGIHDLIVHDYGPGRQMISLHAEVDAKSDLLVIHDTIDNIERELSEKLTCSATIHMDPVITDDPEVDKLKGVVVEFVKAIDEKITIHDFRIVKGGTHTNLIFDLVLPYNGKLSDAEIKEIISKDIKIYDPTLFAVINVDKPYSH